MARMTVRGVFNSWEASATNCFCCCQDRSAGRKARVERSREMTKKQASPSSPTSRHVRSRARRFSRSQVRSAKAKRTAPPSASSRR